MTGDFIKPGGAMMPPQRFGTTTQPVSFAFGCIRARRFTAPARHSTATTAGRSAGVCIRSATSRVSGRNETGSNSSVIASTRGNSASSGSGSGRGSSATSTVGSHSGAGTGGASFISTPTTGAENDPRDVFRGARPFALLYVYDLQARFNSFFTYSPRPESSANTHKRVVLLAMRDAASNQWLKRPSLASAG